MLRTGKYVCTCIKMTSNVLGLIEFLQIWTKLSIQNKTKVLSTMRKKYMKTHLKYANTGNRTKTN